MADKSKLDIKSQPSVLDQIPRIILLAERIQYSYNIILWLLLYVLRVSRRLLIKHMPRQVITDKHDKGTGSGCIASSR